MANSSIPCPLFEIPIPMTAGAAISGTAAAPVAVKLSADGTVIACTTDSTERVVGFVRETVSSGDDVSVYFGITVGVAGEAIARDEMVCPSTVTAGRLDDCDTATDVSCGRALTAAAAAGDLFLVNMFEGGHLHA